MQQYQSTPDFYRDYIEHGWLKDQAAKAHKYIERHRGKNGKWVYVYRKAKNLYERGKQKVKYGTWEDQQRKKATHQDKVDSVTYSKNYFVRKGQGPLAGGLDDRYYPKSYVTKKLGISSLHGDPRYKKSKKKRK